MSMEQHADKDDPGSPDPDAVMADTYERLRRIARQHLRRYRPGETLNTTAVVHEAYIKLAGDAGGFWSDRNEFFKIASTVMRHLIVDYARRQQAEKRGGGAATLAALFRRARHEIGFWHGSMVPGRS